MDLDKPSANTLVAQENQGGLWTKPSPATIAAAESLEKHSTIRKLLQKYLNAHTWPLNDTVPDRLREYTPRPRPSFSEEEEESTSRKRARLGSGNAPATGASSSKPRVGKSTRRITRQKTSSEESLSGEDGQGTRRSSGGSSGAMQRVTRSATSHKPNDNPALSAPQAGPSSAVARASSDASNPDAPGGSQGTLKRITRAASQAANGPSVGRPGGSSTSKPLRTFSKKNTRKGHHK